MWQEIIVGACVIGAVIFLLRRWLPIAGAKNSGSCGGCGGCGTAKSCRNPNEKGQH